MTSPCARSHVRTSASTQADSTCNATPSPSFPPSRSDQTGRDPCPDESGSLSGHRRVLGSSPGGREICGLDHKWPKLYIHTAEFLLHHVCGLWTEPLLVGRSAQQGRSQQPLAACRVYHMWVHGARTCTRTHAHTHSATVKSFIMLKAGHV